MSAVRLGLLDGLGSAGAHFLAEAELRGRVGEFYRSHEGWRSSGDTESLYESFLFPHDRPAWRRSAADGMWSCALTFLAVCRHLGVRHAALDGPYERRVGKAMSDVESVARSLGALVIGPAVASYVPQAGDAMLSGVGDSLHCSCLAEVVDGYRLVAIDGGQGGRGSMAIERNEYELHHGAKSAIVRSVEAPRHSPSAPGPPRPVRSFVDLWAIVINAGLLTA